MLSKGKAWKWTYFKELKVFEFHVVLAHAIDKKKIKANIRK